MKIIDIIKQSLRNLNQQGLRSWLTVLGIVIGVASVISIVSIGSGLQRSISSQTDGLAQRVGVVTPGQQGFSIGPGDSGPSASEGPATLDEVDLRTVKATTGVEVGYGQVQGTADVSVGDQTATITIRGVTPRAWRKANSNVELKSGRFLTSSDRKSVLIGYDISREVYDNNITTNEPILIDNRTFTVVGVLSEDSDRQSTNIIMPSQPSRNLIDDIGPDEYSSIGFIVGEDYNVEDTVTNVRENLRDSRGVNKENQGFTVTSLSNQLDEITNITTTLNYFVGGIAAISLLVGAVGIANTMYMSVLERTKEIGTLKALGAKRIEILQLFVVESAFIGLVGGIIGVSLGYLLSGIIGTVLSRVLTQIPASTYISPGLVLFSLIFAVLMGIVSGAFPALKAARMEPVEALRSE